MSNRFTIKIIILMLFCATIQAQTGGTFTVTQSVIAGGGGTSADTANIFTLDGAIGQAFTATSANSGFNVRSGFFTSAAPLAPTAAAASLSGRIRTEAGKGIRNVRLTLMNTATGEIFYAGSGNFGFYRFENLAVGEGYILTISAKRFTFNPNTIYISLSGDLTETDFIGTQNLQ